MTGARPVVRGVAAVVVNHDGGRDLLSCVASLRRAGVDEVVVVDNASGDGSLAALSGADPGVVLVPAGLNLGYGSGANLGAARCPGAALVLVCNPDVEVARDAVALLAEALCADPELAAVGPELLDGRGEHYPSARAFPSSGVALGHALVGLFWPDNPWTRRYRSLGFDPALERDTDWISGACVLLRRVAFDSVGGFDPGYFMYCEDLDLCWRMRRAGWRVRYVPAAAATHLGGRATARRPWAMLVAHHRSTWRFARRSATGRERLTLPLVAALLALRLAAALAHQARAAGEERMGPSPAQARVR